VADRWPPAIRERPSPVGHWQRFGDPTPVLSAPIPYVWIPYEDDTVEYFYIFGEDPVFVEDNARVQFVPELCESRQSGRYADFWALWARILPGIISGPRRID